MKLLVGVLVVCAAFAVKMPQAEAGKGFFIINTGEDVVEVGTVKPELLSEIEKETQSGVKVGMMYSRFGIFWLDIWRWDKKFCLFAGNTVWEITREQADELATSLSVPFTMTLPPGLIVLIVIGAVLILMKVLKKKDDGGGEVSSGDAPPAG